MGVYSAINWLFDNEDKGIIIEDDCVLRDSFYPFAEELLVRYKDDYRIGMIDAANYRQNISIPHLMDLADINPLTDGLLGNAHGN